MEAYNNLNDEDKLKAENEFLKLKLMLETGAQFSDMGHTGHLPPQIENEFLNYIAEFEKQSQNPVYTKVFEKIGRPGHFKNVADIPDEEIEAAWDELYNHLLQYDIRLDVCSPNISARELYRFTTEELFQHEMNGMNIPGMISGFIYDEFHPDHIYDNSRMVEQDLLKDLFRKDELFYKISYFKKDFVFNEQIYTDVNDFFDKIARFKSLFEEIELKESTVDAAAVADEVCTVTGTYRATACTEKDTISFSGNFKVLLQMNDLDYWGFKSVQIGGLAL